MSPRLVLVGVPGSGKTTVGRALAARLGVGFRDTDADIEAAAGMTIGDMFVTYGEPYFREREHQAVIAALRDHQGVVALGGGAITNAATREALRGHTVVWLQVGLSSAASRVGLNRDRPLLLGNVRGTLRTLMQERAPLYGEVATMTVDTDDKTPDDVVEDILGRLAT